MGKNRDGKVSDYSRSFVALFRELLDRNNVSGQQLADALGVSPSKISSRFTGKFPVDTEMINAAASLIGCTPNQLVAAIVAGMEGDIDPEVWLVGLTRDEAARALWNSRQTLDKAFGKAPNGKD